jgi:hypothetical protein
VLWTFHTMGSRLSFSPRVFKLIRITAYIGTFPNWVWECTPTDSALGRQRQEDREFEASPGYLARPIKKKKKPFFFMVGGYSITWAHRL